MNKKSIEGIEELLKQARSEMNGARVLSAKFILFHAVIYAIVEVSFAIRDVAAAIREQRGKQ